MLYSLIASLNRPCENLCCYSCCVETDGGIEARLRELGFGYRARFLQQSAQLILDTHSPDWLLQLRRAPYKEAREALRTLPGVGLKVTLRLLFLWRNSQGTSTYEAFVVLKHVFQPCSTAIFLLLMQLL